MTTRKRSITATFGSRYHAKRTKEVFEILEDCSKCGKTKKEIEKALKEGIPPSREEVIRRAKEAGLPLKF